jgi:hypothetical protein
MKHRYAAVNKFDSSSPGLVYKDLLLYYVNLDLSYRQYSRRRNPLERKQNWTTFFSIGCCKRAWRPVVCGVKEAAEMRPCGAADWGVSFQWVPETVEPSRENGGS